MNKNVKKKIFLGCGVLTLLLVAILLIVFLPSCGDDEKSVGEIDPGIDITRSVTEDGLHIAKVNTNEKGEIENNSYGRLIDKLPADVVKVAMKTEEGNYTLLVENPVNEDGTTEAATYTLEGFEDYNLAATNPALLVGAVCNIDFIKVADLSGEDASDYGLDNPRVQATAYYSDSTYSVVKIGGEASGGEHCYIQFGDNNTVYIAAVSEIEALLLSITDQFDTAINSDKTYISDEDFDEIVLGGTHLKEELVMVGNDDKSIDCAYLLSSHSDQPVNATEGSAIVGAIKSIVTDEVVAVNPDNKKLEELSLNKPYATVETTYVFTERTYDVEGREIQGDSEYLEVSLMTSKPDADGNVFLMQENGKLVYKIAESKLPWVNTTYEKLMSEYVLKPNYEWLKSVELEANGKTYKFELSNEEVTAEDDSDPTVAQKVHLNGKEVNADQFNILFEDLTLMQRGGKDNGTATKGVSLKITYNYLSDRESDKVVLYNTDTQKVVEEVNSIKYGYVYKSYVTSLVSNIEALAQGKEIAKVTT